MRFSGLVNQVRSRLGLFAAVMSVGVVSLLSGEAFAQTGQTIDVQAPNINWASLPSTIIGALTTPIVVGIGIALSVWVILKAVSFFKRSGA